MTWCFTASWNTFQLETQNDDTVLFHYSSQTKKPRQSSNFVTLCGTKQTHCNWRGSGGCENKYQELLHTLSLKTDPTRATKGMGGQKQMMGFILKIKVTERKHRNRRQMSEIRVLSPEILPTLGKKGRVMWCCGHFLHLCLWEELPDSHHALLLDNH